jgi:hypothetical protein
VNDDLNSTFLNHSHWGVFEPVVADGKLVAVRSFAKDSDPSPLLHSIPDAVSHRSRVMRPAVREGAQEWAGHDLLEAFGRRAAEYDRQNRFFAEVCAPGCGVYRCGNLALEGARRRKSLVLGGKTIGEHALVQDKIATAAIELDAIRAHVERLAQDWADRVDHGPLWAAKLFAAKAHAVEGARRVVDLALNIEGAGSLARSNELERLYRDVRAGGFHPPSANTASEVIARSYLNLPATVTAAEQTKPSHHNGSTLDKTLLLS